MQIWKPFFFAVKLYWVRNIKNPAKLPHIMFVMFVITLILSVFRRNFFHHDVAINAISASNHMFGRVIYPKNCPNQTRGY